MISAKTAGFCFGVKNAVDTVFEQIQAHRGKKIYTYGPIIHNGEVIKQLEQEGVVVLNSRDALAALTEGVVIIRSHGVEKSIYDLAKSRGLEIVDATCPFVTKIHKIVQKESEAGSFILIVGDPKHPEVQGIQGWIAGSSVVVQTPKDLEGILLLDDLKICIVAQTTFNYNKFQDIVEIVAKKGYNVSVLNTICNATKERQEEAKEIAEVVEVMIVIGDKHSSNTQKLFEICQNACKATYYIQTLEDLNLNQLRLVETVGITAGASTPNTIIEEVQSKCQSYLLNRC